MTLAKRDPAQPNASRMRWILLLPLIVFLALAVLFLSRLGEDPHHLPSALQGQPLPDFVLPVLGSDESMSRDRVLMMMQGRFFLLNVWGSWCASCYEEHGYLTGISMGGIPIVGLNYKDAAVDAERFLQRMGNPFAVVLQDSGAYGLDLGVYGAPETYLVDPQGVIVFRHAGPMTADVWQADFLPRIHLPTGSGE